MAIRLVSGSGKIKKLEFCGYVKGSIRAVFMRLAKGF